MKDYYGSKKSAGANDRAALGGTIEILESNTGFIQNQKERMYNDTSGRYLMETNPYEIAYEDWIDNLME